MALKIESVKNAIWCKRTLYVLCFLTLNLIDLLRNTQTGDIWKTVANCTGFVVMLLIASAYPLKNLMSVFSCIWTGICVCLAVGVIVYPATFLFGMYKWVLVTVMLNIWWIVLFYQAFFLPRIKAKTAWSWINALGWIWIAMTVLMTINVSGRVWPIWFLAMFSLFYATQYTKEDAAALTEAMIDGTIIAFFAIQIYAYGFRPYDRVRYLGAYPNSNVTSLHYLIVYTVLLLKLHLLEQKRASKWWKLFYLLGAGGLLGFLFMTMGRTAWVTAIVITFLYGILVVRRIWDKHWIGVMTRGVALVLSFVILFPVVFGTVRWLPTILHHPIWYEGEYALDKVHSFDPADSEKYIELDEFMESVLGRIWGTFRISVNSPFVLKAYAAEQDYEVIEVVGPEGMDRALRERLSIYKAYWDHLTWLGHPETEGHYRLENSSYYSWHAQNVWLQMAYSYGIPAGICFVLLTVVMLAYYVKKMRTANVPCAIIPFFICVMFFVYGIMELDWNVGQYALFLFFFVQHPRIFTEIEQTDQQMESIDRRFRIVKE